MEDSGKEYWNQGNYKGLGNLPRPIYQQIAVVLYVLGGGGTGERSRIILNIGYGTVRKYVWLTPS